MIISVSNIMMATGGVTKKLMVNWNGGKKGDCDGQKKDNEVSGKPARLRQVCGCGA